MPKIDTPDVRKGFWLAIGVLLALLAVSVIKMIIASARRKGG